MGLWCLGVQEVPFLTALALSALRAAAAGLRALSLSFAMGDRCVGLMGWGWVLREDLFDGQMGGCWESRNL